MAFMDDRYLLSGDTAAALFAKVRDLPVVDPHNHADVKEIAANRNYPDLWRLFAGTDHYVWSVMRKTGIPEDYITGSATPKEKWARLAAAFPKIAGNPVYEWIHLDLRRGLGIHKTLNAATAEEIWEEGNAVLAKESSRPLALLDRMNVEVMCSTDDPLDTLEEHERINRAAGRTLVRPTWRPDKAMNIFKPTWREYIEKLGKRFDTEIRDFDALVAVLKRSHDYFHARGCRVSDHALVTPLSGSATAGTAQRVFHHALFSEMTLGKDDRAAFMSALMGEMSEMNAARGWVTQLHIGATRDIRDSLFQRLGPDCGGDVSDHYLDILPPLRAYLNRFDGRLKVVLYCLDAVHQATLATISRAYDEKVRLGSAWWLCDNPIGMRRQLEYIGSVELLSNFAGMVSDSRKLLSYQSRFEMFRRVLCDVIGQMVDYGQMPEDAATELVVNMCYHNPKAYFGL